ncbi:protein kinase [Streptomyces sp. NPDC046887]|uniref:serine/threonine-protein kinase n=1 Tax=Streptomyces sp. NPDC046887 TaxID=3155472 RepID=UPI0033CB2B36
MKLGAAKGSDGAASGPDAVEARADRPPASSGQPAAGTGPKPDKPTPGADKSTPGADTPTPGADKPTSGPDKGTERPDAAAGSGAAAGGDGKPGQAEPTGAEPADGRNADGKSADAKTAEGPRTTREFTKETAAGGAGDEASPAKPADRVPTRKPVSSAKEDGPAKQAGAKQGGETDTAKAQAQDLTKGKDKGKDGAGASGARPGSGSRSGSGSGSSHGSGSGNGGRLLAGRYRLDGVLGRGGMGTVWRAVDETLGRTVAVKELRFPNSIDEEEKRRLITRTLREAKAIARIRNNGAVTVYDVVDEDDRPWIVMELIEGKSLADAVREDGLLTPKRAAEVGLAVLDVLRSAHREGILHRDVKPSNVLIGADGRVVLTDFGIAQVEGDPSITSTGMLVGAPSYISPERARGHKPGPAADMWSLGGLLYASVEGCPPYDKGSAIATLTAVMTEQLDPPKNAGPLTEVIYGLLEKDAAKRLDDAGARALLQAVIRAPEPAAVEESSPEATRVVPLPPVPPAQPAPLEKREKRTRGGDRTGSRTAGAAGAAGATGAERPATEAAAERMRGALRSVRNAAAATSANRQDSAARSRTTTTAAGTGSGVTASQGRGPAAPPRAPLTDVVSRRTLVVIAVVVVLVIAAIVAVIAAGGDDPGTKGQGGPGADRTASAGSEVEPTGASGSGTGQGESDGKADGKTDGKDDGKDEGKGGQPGGGPSPGASGDDRPEDGGTPGTGGDDGKPGGLPAGYTTVSNDTFHFSMAMPKDFSLKGIAGQNSGGKFWGASPYPRVQVDFTGDPKGDAALAWNLARAGVAVSSNGYRHIGIAKVDYKGYPTVADWQFERDENGERVRVLNRGFKVDAGRGYSIMISCPVAEWGGKECTTLRETAFASFTPKG